MSNFITVKEVAFALEVYPEKPLRSPLMNQELKLVQLECLGNFIQFCLILIQAIGIY